MDNKNNYCVIMSGGIGSRFWPFSREARPKQFLDFFGTGRSLLQMTVDRFSKILPVENIYIVTNQEYAQMVMDELPELKPNQILLEPMRRNTAPCIAFATYHINSFNPEANIVVAPSDHLILKEDEFLAIIQKAYAFVEKHNTLLTLGIRPSRPETGYGYIQMGEDELEGVTKVKVFTEKPNLELAKVFYESGEFLWNSGIFIWNNKTILEAFHQYLPEITNRFDQGAGIFGTEREKAFIDENFPFCPNISIDYGIMEKAGNVYVQAADFGWSDLGTWGSLYEISDKDEDANAALIADIQFFDSSENMVTLPAGKLAVIQGLDGYIVAEADNVLLICKKDEEQRIKQFVADVKLKYGDKYI
ncbi:mannose-1-phosphate guanylyltransferase [Dysgonomonas sp. PFB1-18]|uniref:mannose-1-phosphate guanylyltransferase n=1 Tax=unclassified Dysgonomonas TaxID=2630389 RepID=UPI002472FD37|nr:MULTISPECIES: mannose-1-phosphate guanylyltransferase [unclassified Dysgonomonas]MDH6307540.1 mannose-1-phosphate guanylyltransferase [Dysgonomonas sp. PF1-14]MDH6337458.1 mannose-1-phosphate guanylyltransferase [Dysgonomonas sp. PF1-16]MDH6379382.1 mannose-1-phosphate guanylyltransferase [Dysgonomonas sp. PFB1-18]MDH6395980.1 mannose-1-phosphate guanylyltransferase [Dysgonomonas sp. PF1-23]